MMLLFLVAGASEATMTVRRLALDELTQRAANIVHGTIVEVRSGRDAGGVPATWTTIEIARALKGQAARRVTIKQFGVSEPLPDGTLLRVPGLPRFSAGEEVVLFLHAESARGFASPVGLSQGVFRVGRDGEQAYVARDSNEGRQPLAAFLAETMGRVARTP